MKNVVRERESMRGKYLRGRDRRRVENSVKKMFPDATKVEARHKAYCAVYVESPSLAHGYAWIGWEELP